MSVEAVDQSDPPSAPTQDFPQVEVGNHFSNHWSSSQTNQASWFRFLLAGAWNSHLVPVPPGWALELPPGSGSSWLGPGTPSWFWFLLELPSPCDGGA